MLRRRAKKNSLVVIVAIIFNTHFSVLAQKNGGSLLAPNSRVSQPSYDVVSIKPNKSGDGPMGFDVRPDGYFATNVSIEVLLMDAFDVRDTNIIGLPHWTAAARYDLEAKVLDDGTFDRLSPEQKSRMLEQILASRFGLKAHFEMRDSPVYKLVVAKGGSKVEWVINGNSVSQGFVRNRGNIHGNAMSMSTFALQLAFTVQRDVIDNTGLSGRYRIDLEWEPDESALSVDKTGSKPMLFTALREQLGLQLIPSTGKTRFLVVDQIRRPDPN